MHSGTKYLGGHSDLICGAVAGRQELIDKNLGDADDAGHCMDPHASWVLVRGMKTLAVRVVRQNENAQAGSRIFYPSMPRCGACTIRF